MKNLSTNELRKLFLDFFVSKGHRLFKSDSLVPTNDPSVLFTSAGMNQFKDYFLGKVGDVRRATSCQKCFRTGDLDEVGQTPFHHTFFEMLGNFSFGDYFKEEAIEWAWEFVTEVLEIDQEQLWVSIYQDDEEAYNLWRQRIGVPPDRIKRFGQKENFWPSNAISEGPNGPCGPCSEIYYRKENGGSVELWNLVFTQFNRCEGGQLQTLPSKGIDTGMGLERMSSVLQGVDSNFKIDIFRPVVEAVKKSIEARQESLIHMLADHGRAVTFCIGDGVMPSNDGRGYVVRKLIRRCLHMVSSEKPRPFLYKVVSSVCEAMKEPYPELLERRDNIAQIIKAEEEKYIKNILEGGRERLGVLIKELKSSGNKELSGETGLDLYVTYGIQPEFTKERCEQEGIQLDLEKVNALIKQEQQRSRRTSKISDLIFSKEGLQLKNSQFVGYELDSCQAKVTQIIKDNKDVDKIEDSSDLFWLVLDKTPFYGESGGQVGDKGEITLVKDNRIKLRVVDTKKQGDSVIHQVKGSGSIKDFLKVGDEVMAHVDIQHREAVKRAHTTTHLLQAVLRKVLGSHVQQAGSLVEPDRFRFDFTHFQDIKPQEMDSIQDLLNTLVIHNDRLIAEVMPKSQAQQMGALALFGEKYEDFVRVVSVGDYSKEFCGGTHLDNTGKIGLVVLTAEYSVGSGVRRIEAVTGRLAYQRFQELTKLLEEASLRLKSRPEQLLTVLDQFIAKHKSLEKEYLRLKERELAFEVDNIIRNVKKIKGVSLISHPLKGYDISLLRRGVDLLKEKVKRAGIFFLSSVQEDNAYVVCGLTEDLVKRGLSADNLIKKILPLIGGSGGGRRDFAQGGSRDTSKINLALKEIENLIKEELKR